MNSSPNRNTFQKEKYLERKAEKGEEPSEAYLEMWETEAEMTLKREADPAWQQNNLEYDLRSTKWICDKAKASESYAQNLYAAMCNQGWQKNDVWPLLNNQRYSCSWRYAGGIIADMREEGDYIDWYCSGIRGYAGNEELAGMTEEQRNKYNWYQEHFVSEGFVTDEIREDFFKLGWVPVDTDYE